MDDSASSPSVTVLRVQGRIPTDSGSGCVPGPLVGPTHRLTPHSTHFLSEFSNETHPDIGGPVGSPVSRTCIRGNDGRFGGTGRSSLQKVHRCSVHWKNNGEDTGVIQKR